jgi:hypothetical protein
MKTMFRILALMGLSPGIYLRHSLLMIACLFVVTNAYAEKLPLPSYTGGRSFEQIVKDSQGIVIAELVAIGDPQPGPPMSTIYVSDWKIIRNVRNVYPEKAKFTFMTAYDLDTKPIFRMPEIGQRYIIVTHFTEAQASYILDYTTENLRRVESVIKARSSIALPVDRVKLHVR